MLSWWVYCLDDIHGLCCRFLFSADGDVVARLTESVCVTFRDGGGGGLKGPNHFTPLSRESCLILTTTIRGGQFIDEAHLQQSPKYPEANRGHSEWCAHPGRRAESTAERVSDIGLFNIDCVVAPVQRRQPANRSFTTAPTYKSDTIDFLRYRSGERRRIALIHGLQEEGEPRGLAQKIRLYRGCNLKIPTPPPPPPLPPPSSLTALRPGQSVRQGGSGEESDKAGEDERRSPLAGLIQSPIPSRLGTCLSIHEDDSAASPGDFVPRSTFDSRDPNSEVILRLLVACS